jgi:hypothetical protein
VGGGFMSFDAPRAHFGLGQESQATTVRIRWADGTKSEATGRLEAGHIYTVRRN